MPGNADKVKIQVEICGPAICGQFCTMIEEHLLDSFALSPPSREVSSGWNSKYSTLSVSCSASSLMLTFSFYSCHPSESQGHEKSFSPPLYFNEIWSTPIPLDHALPLTVIKYCHHHLLQADQIHVSVKRHYVFVRFKQRPLDITFFISVLATQGHSTVRFKKYLFERQKI